MPNACEGSEEVPHYHRHSDGSTIGADEAWRTLKAHPKANYSNLAMLAEVVARGTRCLSPTEHDMLYSPHLLPDKNPPDKSSSSPSMPTSTSTTQSMLAPGLVPLQELVRKRRRFEVSPSAVQEALVMLDSQPNVYQPGKKRKLSDIRDQPYGQ